MHQSALESVMWALSVVARLLLLSVLLSRRLYRPFPVFTAWIAFSVLLDPLYYLVFRSASPATYSRFYFAMTFPDEMLQIGILLEIISNVLRPVKRSLPKGALIVLGVLAVAAGVLAFFVAAHLSSGTLEGGRRQVVVDTTVSILRITIFLGMALFAQVLGLGWKSHVLQLGTGLGFYAAISLVTELVHSHLPASPDYAMYFNAVSQVNTICYLGTVAFWCRSFARQEAARKEFSPQMAKILVSISDNTKRQREAVVKKRA